MNQDDIDKNGGEKVPLNILVPRVNGFLLKDVKSWAKSAYHYARVQVGWRKAQKIKEIMPIETADYAVRKTFGNWRLVAPTREGEKSPLQQVIEAVRPYIISSEQPFVPQDKRVASSEDNPHPSLPATRYSRKWGQFRRKFVRLLKLAFNAICESDYDPKMVDEMNGWLDELLSSEERVAREKPQSSLPATRYSVKFVLKPETAIGYSAPEMLAIRSAIWERFTGKGLDPAQYANPTAAGRLMEMELVISPAPNG